LDTSLKRRNLTVGSILPVRYWEGRSALEVWGHYNLHYALPRAFSPALGDLVVIRFCDVKGNDSMIWEQFDRIGIPMLHKPCLEPPTFSIILR
jgi:hypothetical protein